MDNMEKVKVSSTTPSSPSTGKVGGSTDVEYESSSEENLTMPVGLIGAENYLTLTEGKPSALTREELTEAVVKCKELILNSAVVSEERKWLVRRLIELRYQLLTVEEVKEDSSPATVACWSVEASSDDAKSRLVLGHHFKIRYEPTSTNKRYCDTCCGAIWNVIQYWYQCSDCRYRCHTRCVEAVLRPCPHLTSAEQPGYETRICPELGLAAQNYLCAECKVAISFKNSWLAPRLCDYSGLYYCTSCHWNNSMSIPARVSRNWDFKPYSVSRASYQLLRFTRQRPIISLHPSLYGFVKELAELNRLREEISLMKPYLVRCREAKLEQKILWQQFGTKAHLLEPFGCFSLQDMTDLNSGKLMEQMKDAASKFVEHITKSCALCRGQGYRCELCEDKDDVFFPFYTSVYSCPQCSWAYHKSCWLNSPVCRKCERINRWKQELALASPADS